MKMIAVVVAATALTLPASVFAGECSGVNARYFEDAVALHEVEDGPTTYFVRSTGGSTQTVPADKVSARCQHCVGFFVAHPDGPPTGTGNCYAIDADGDIDVATWDVGGGETTWETVRGTGKFEARIGSSGTGSQGARFGDGLGLVEWSGTCTD